ncbi:MAG: adenylate/guanylate cyclase domain-containing protein [Simkaniaceae bacterium]
MIIYKETYDLVFTEVRNKGLTISATAAEVIDGDKIPKLKGENDSPQIYQDLYNDLLAIKNAVAGVFTDIKYIYIVIPSKHEAGKYIYAVDAEENPELHSKYGDPFTLERFDYEAVHSDKPMAMDVFETDKWGTWLSTAAPIYDSKGEKVGTLYVDIGQSHLKNLGMRLFKKSLIALAVAVIIALSFAHFLTRIMTNSLQKLGNTISEVGKGNLDTCCKLRTKDEFQNFAKVINQMIEGLKERERLKLGFARYVSSYVLEKILQSEVPAKLEGERKKVTVLFSDIRQFTSLSETLPPEQVVKILNQYFSKMIQVIFHFRGTLDKFIGDAIMAEFGAPLNDDQQERHAVLAALGMQKELGKLNHEWKKEGFEALQIGIGIYTGYAIIGDVGSERRMEYTAIGEAVDTAQGFESMTKTLDKPILVAESTYEKVKDEFAFAEVGEIQLPDRKEKVKAYHLLIEENLDKLNSYRNNFI